MWTDYKPNADFCEAIMCSSFDHNGKKEPTILVTENDNCNAIAMLFSKLLTGRASAFADVRTYWSPSAIKRVSGWLPDGKASDGFIHLLNSGAAALDGNGASKDSNGNSVMKKWWEVNDKDIKAMLENTKWSPANRGYFRGGGYSSSYSTHGEMPVTLVRVNMVNGLGYVLQLAEGWTLDVPEKVNKILLDRTDPTWPSTWFVPRLDKNNNAFKDVYSVMAAWGANHGGFTYGHIGAELITLSSMLRIPVSLHNVCDSDIYRPHSWTAFGTKDAESVDYRACSYYGPLYK
jgi:L-fucose isomerase